MIYTGPKIVCVLKRLRNTVLKYGNTGNRTQLTSFLVRAQHTVYDNSK